MKKMNLGIRFILGFLSVILCILLVVATLTTAILADLNIVFQTDNLQKLLTETLFTSATTRLPAPHAAIGGNGTGVPSVQRFPIRMDDAAALNGAEGADNSAMVEWIYGAITEQFGDAEGVPTLEAVQEFVDKSTISDFLTEKTASIISDIITGSSNTTITTAEIQTLLEENAQLIQDTFGIEMNEEIISQVVAVVEENEIVQTIQKEGVTKVVEDMVASGAIDIPMDILPMPDSGEGDSGSSVMDILKSVQSVVSVSTLLMAIGVCVVLIALLLVTNIKRIWIGINNTGISLTIAGSILMALTCLRWFASDLLLELLKEAGPVAKIILHVLKSTAPVHIGIFAGGIVLIIGGCILRAILKKRAKAAVLAAEAAAIEETLEEAPVEEVAEEPMAEVAPAVEETPAQEPVAEEAPAEEETPAEEEAPAEPVQ